MNINLCFKGYARMAYHIFLPVLRLFQYYRGEIISVIQQVFIENLYKLITVLGAWGTVYKIDQILALMLGWGTISVS